MFAALVEQAKQGDREAFDSLARLTNGGTYRWSIDGDKLHFEPVGTDPCPFQAERAGNRTYTRYD